MSNTKQVKILRGQVRQAVQEILPDILKEVLAESFHKKLSDEAAGRLVLVEELVKNTLNKIDERSKDIQSFMLRAATMPEVPVVQEDVLGKTINVLEK